MDDELSLTTTHEVRDRCLCLRVQRSARAMARRFDRALGEFGLTNGQFSMMVALNRPEPPRIADLAPFLAMDRTTLTAALKPLVRRGVVESIADERDARSRRLLLTEAGRELLVQAVPVWRQTHDELDRELGQRDIARLRDDLAALA